MIQNKIQIVNHCLICYLLVLIIKYQIINTFYQISNCYSVKDSTLIFGIITRSPFLDLSFRETNPYPVIVRDEEGVIGASI
jgi:hypothetical protein